MGGFFIVLLVGFGICLGLGLGWHGFGLGFAQVAIF